jgi:cadmium resistance protein CadD (predicted permease)
MVAVVILSLAMFTATNVDGLFVLMAFYADPSYGHLQIVAGQYAAMAALFFASLAAARAAVVFPPALVGWLGLVPIAMGCKKLWNRHAAGRAMAGPGGGQAAGGTLGRTLGRTLAVAAVATANGGDNLGLYTPQFAIHSTQDVAVMGLVFAVLTGLWCLAARAVLSHPAVSRVARAQGPRWVPWGLIGLGFWTLLEAGRLRHL